MSSCNFRGMQSIISVEACVAPTANISLKLRLGKHFSRHLRRFQKLSLSLTCRIRAENQFNGENCANSKLVFSVTYRFYKWLDKPTPLASTIITLFFINNLETTKRNVRDLYIHAGHNVRHESRQLPRR
jgi:hypothetical protein